MPGDIVCKILDSTGNYEQVLDYIKITYSSTLNGLGSFEIIIKGTNSYTFSKYVKYKYNNGPSGVGGVEQGIVKFYKAGVLELKGKVENINTTSKGNMVISGRSVEVFGANRSITTPARTAESRTTRVTAFIGDIYRVTTGTLSFNDATNMAVKNYGNLSPLQAIKTIANNEDLLGSEYFMDFKEGTDELNVNKTVGCASSIFSLCDGVDFTFLTRSEDPKGVVNSVTYTGGLVSGGTAYATGSYSDPTSIAENGVTWKGFTDRTLLDNPSCVTAATNYVKANKDAINYITINGLINVDLLTEYPSTSGRTSNRFALGDVITVTSPKNNISSATLRIISFTRTIDNQRRETLALKTLVSGIKMLSTGDVTNANSVSLAGGVIAGTTEATSTGAGMSNVAAGGASVVEDSSGFNGDSETLTSNTAFLACPVGGSNHTQLLMATGTICVLNSSLGSGTNLIKVYMVNHDTSTIISNVHWLRIEKPGHVHTGPSHYHPSADGTYTYYRLSDGGTNYSVALGTGNAGTGNTGSSNDTHTSLSFTVITTKDIYTGSSHTAVDLVFYSVGHTLTINYYGNCDRAGLHTHLNTFNDTTHSNAKGTLYVESGI